MHASRLEMFSKAMDEVQDARAREAAGGVVPMQIGAVKRQGQEGQGRQGQR